MSKSIKSYGKIYNVGHRAVQDVFKDPVLVEEKVDGSQFSFGIIDMELVCCSRNRNLDLHNPDKLFAPAVLTVKSLADKGLLVEGALYRGECVSSTKHNTLKYGRVPKGNIALFDVDLGDQFYVSADSKIEIANRLGIDVVPCVFEGVVSSVEQIKELMQRTSFLGEAVIEGLVFKNYNRYHLDGKVMMAKYVSETFKETHRKNWKDKNPSNKDIKQQIIETFKTTARWEKAVQHLRDDGLLTDSPTDIGPLLKELNKDLLQECSQEISDMLFEWARKDIQRGVSNGFAEWYKEKLLANPFEEEV